jgi:hypothetical protein
MRQRTGRRHGGRPRWLADTSTPHRRLGAVNTNVDGGDLAGVDANAGGVEPVGAGFAASWLGVSGIDWIGTRLGWLGEGQRERERERESVCVCVCV